MTLLPNILVEALGWTLVHSLWQATILLIVLGFVLLALRRRSAQLKYFISYLTLVGVLVWGATTFVRSYRFAAEKQVVRARLLENPKQFKDLLLVTTDQDHEVKPVKTSEELDLGMIRFRAFFQRHFNLICLIWLAGMALMTVRMIAGLLYSRKLKRFHLVALPEEWCQWLADFSQRLGISRKVEGFFSPLAKVPMTLGALKPVILFPVTAFTGLSPREIEAVLAHELAHVLRNDYLFNIFQSVIELLFFFHPAVWAISGRIRAERENSCDNIAVSVTGDRLSYIKALAAVQTRYAGETQFSMAFSVRQGTVLQRIKRLQNEIAMKTNLLEGLIAMGIIVVGLTLASFVSAGNQYQPVPAGARDAVPALVADSIRPVNRDSIKAVLEEKIKREKTDEIRAEELRKAVEVAWSETDEEASAEMMNEIDQAINEINVEKIVREAMCVAAQAMKEASVEVDKARLEIDREEINRDMREAAREIEEARREMERDMRHDMACDGIGEETIEAAVKAASAGMDIAASVVGSLDIEGIVSSALTGVSAALDAMGTVSCDSSVRKTEPDRETNEKARIKQLEQEKKQLEKQQKQLEKQLKDLEKRLEKLEE